MYASSPEELKKLIEENVDEFPSTFLADDSFAYQCYSNHSYMDLKKFFDQEKADSKECSKWNISEGEWRSGIEMALMVHYYEALR